MWYEIKSINVDCSFDGCYESHSFIGTPFKLGKVSNEILIQKLHAAEQWCWTIREEKLFCDDFCASGQPF